MGKIAAIVFAAWMLTASNCYEGERKKCGQQFFDCTGDCGDQTHFEVPIEGDCTQQCLQNLSKCVRRARQ